MSEIRVWFVRAGEGGSEIQNFRTKGIVALAWREVGPVEATVTDEDLEARFEKAFPNAKLGTRRVWAAQVRRFVREPKVGDRVVTYDAGQRLYYLGSVESNVEWADQPMCHVRKVKWTHETIRDRLSATTRNSLGSIATFFSVAPETEEELWRMSSPIGATRAPSASVPPPPAAAIEEGAELRDEMVEKSSQLIQDRIIRLKWADVQELVSGVLRGMGYRTRVSERGPDRGVDIFASPDGLGLQEPRIFVEVKHQQAAMGAPEVRAFLGGRRPGDRCIYVSTGGFTKEAKYEADRSSVPIALVAIDQLRELIVEHYEKLDAVTKALVPLQRIYWPVE